jgi:hypothetical protein
MEKPVEQSEAIACFRHILFGTLGMLLVPCLLMHADVAIAQSKSSQESHGNCSPNITAGGSVTVVCPGDAGAAHPREHADTANAPSSTNADGVPGSSQDILANAIKVKGRFVRFTRWAIDAQSCPNGASCAFASFVIQNASGAGLSAAIRRGSTSVGSCAGYEADSTGLNLYGQPRTFYYSYYSNFESAQRFIPAGASVPITIKLEHCTDAGAETVDISTSLTISAKGQVFEIPISAMDVPVRN